jgi:hypothetical protein
MTSEQLSALNRLVKSNKSDLKSKNALAIVAAVLKIIFYVAVFLGTVIFIVWSSAYVGATLWAWFIIPTFGLPVISMPVAFGIALLVRFWTYQPAPNFAADVLRPSRFLDTIVLLATPWFVLLVGYICKVYFLA